MSSGAVLTVGGTFEPLVTSLTEREVECALFAASAVTKPVVDQVRAAVGYDFQWECLVLDDPDDLVRCYEQIRIGIDKWLTRRDLQPDDVHFDYTGGTKTMSAALALAAMELQIPRYHYVSGQRSKEGAGTVISGTERSVEGANPWITLGVRQRELATKLYEQRHIEAATELLAQAADLVYRGKEALRAQCGLCEILTDLDLFRLKGLSHRLGQIRAKLQLIWTERGLDRNLEWLEEFGNHVVALEREQQSRTQYPASLLELLANARRRAAQGRYDDAAARLYRAVELNAQNMLYEAFGAISGLINLPGQTPEVEAALREQFHTAAQDNQLKLSCKDAYAALRHGPNSDHHAAYQVYESLAAPLQKRNESWLAHGVRPVSMADFVSMWRAVIEGLRVDEGRLPTWPELDFTR